MTHWVFPTTLAWKYLGEGTCILICAASAIVDIQDKLAKVIPNYRTAQKMEKSVDMNEIHLKTPAEYL